MIARGFKSVIWAATVGGAALGCYMVSLRVATERNELARVERQIVAAKREIRSLQTELGTRGRMTQLEQWNAEVLALAAPNSAQFLQDEFTLARFDRREPTVAERSAEVRLASAPTAAPKPSAPARPAVPAVVQAIAEPPAAAPTLIRRASLATIEATAKPADTPASTHRSRPTLSDTKAVKPAGQRTAAAPARPETPASRANAKPSAKPAAAGTGPAAAPAKPVREAAAAVREPKVKGSGGN